MTLMSDVAFKWVLTALTGGLAGAWLIYDAIRLVRSRSAVRGDPIASDKRFGYMVGVVIGVIGVVGVLRYHGVL